MPRLKQKLLSLLKDAARVAVVGIGSELRGDDAAGLLVLEHLRKRIAKRKRVGREPPWPSSGRPAPPNNKQWRCEDARALPVNKSFCPSGPAFKLFNGGTAPENLTGEIRRFKPGHLIMIDAVELRQRPGTMALVDLKQVENNAFLTHKLPLKLMLDYLAAEMSFVPIIIGIQPKNLDFGTPVSKEVIRAGRKTADLLLSALKGFF